MRKTDVRKWIHALLDMLPLIVIPVFMVYSHRHTIDTYSVQAEETKVVNFNQLNDYDISGSAYGLDYSFTDGNIDISGTFDTNSSIALAVFDKPITNHKYLIRNGFYNSSCRFTNNNAVDDEINGYDLIFHCIDDTYNNYWLFTSSMYDVAIDFNGYFSIFDLTLMFGSGSEPSITQFNSWYPYENFEYNTGTKQLLYTGNLITYDDTDVGSQFFYTLYNTTDKYFNFGNTFGFNNLYDWLNLNIFNGQAPLSVFVVWNIFLYEFLMDLIFLLYALFMFFIDFCTNLIERFYCSARGGR